MAGTKKTKKQVREEFKSKLAELDKTQKAIVDRQKNIPVYGNGRHPFQFTGQAPYGTSGALGEKGYSVTKMAAIARGVLQADQAKEEIEIGRKLMDAYVSEGFRPYATPGYSWLVPYAVDYMPDGEKFDKLRTEIRQKMAATVRDVDLDEAKYYALKSGQVHKAALATYDDSLGGFLRGAPIVGELIELQRNNEVFSRVGASQVSLPPNGMMDYPKHTDTATSYWIKEGGAPSESNPRFGNLALRAKKLATLVKMTNDLLRFASPSVEALVRTDIAKSAALKADLGMLEGDGDGEPLGIINYPTTGADALIDARTNAYDTPDANTGYLFQPEDVRRMVNEMPDEVDPNAFIMRRNLWGRITDRRTDAVVAADGKGRFVFYPDRKAGEAIPERLDDRSVLWSSQVSAARTRGSATGLTYMLLGQFVHWLIARLGVMEFVSNGFADSVFATDQTLLRGIQYMDAAARHAQAFSFFDQIQIA